MATTVSSVVFFSSDPEGLAAVLRAVDVDLAHEVHEDEVEHWACELGDIHVAVYRGETPGSAPGLREGGSTFVGVYVTDLDRCAEQVGLDGLPAGGDPCGTPVGVPLHRARTGRASDRGQPEGSLHRGLTNCCATRRARSDHSTGKK